MANPHKNKTQTSTNNTKNNKNPMDNIPLPDNRYLSTKLTLLNYALIPFFLTASFFICKFIYNEDFKKVEHPLVEKASSYLYSLSNFKDFESKLNFVLFAFALAAALNLLLTFLTIISRVFTGASSPQAESDPLVVSTFNRVIQNNLEQALIFFPLLAHFVLNVNSNNSAENNKLAVLYVIMFFTGRIVFFVGYLVSLLTKIVGLRVTGFGINMIVSFLLVVKYLGFKDFELRVNTLFA